MNPQIFLSGFKNFPVHTCPHASDGIRIYCSTRAPLQLNVFRTCAINNNNRASDSGGKFALLSLLCRHIGLLFGKRLDTNLYVIGIKNIRIHPSTRYRIRCELIFFFTLESGFKNIRICCRIRRMRVDGSRIRKEKVACGRAKSI